MIGSMNITEFLEARIAEDEAALEAVPVAAQQLDDFDFGGTDDYLRFTIGYGRVIAECETKRAIVSEHASELHSNHGIRQAGGCARCNWDRELGWVRSGPCATLMSIAAVYANHPDYQQEWAK